MKLRSILLLLGFVFFLNSVSVYADSIYNCDPSQMTLQGCIRKLGESDPTYKLPEVLDRTSLEFIDKKDETIPNVIDYIFDTVIKNLLLLGIAVGAVMVVINGFKMVTGAAKAEERKKVLNNILHLAIGMVAMGLAYFIVDNVIKLIYSIAS